MNFVKQQHERGCAVACAAMLTGVSYDKVWRDQTSGFSPEEVLSLRAMHWSFYLSHLGFEVGGLYIEDGALLDVTQSFPLGVPYLCGLGLAEEHVDSHPDNTHAIVIDENGVVFDPATDAPGIHPLSHYRTFPKKLLMVASVEDRRLMNL
jgi:hypothetical protein